MGEPLAWQTSSAASAIALPEELRNRGFGPVDTAVNRVAGSFVTVPDDSENLEDVRAFLATQPGVTGPTPVSKI